MSTPPPPPKMRHSAGLLGARDMVLLVWFYAYALVTIEPRLLYISCSPQLSLTPEFLAPFLRRSGGLMEYVSLLLAQSFALDWLGALVLTLEAALILVLTQACLNVLAGRRVGFLRYVPVTLFILLCSRYGHPVGVGPTLIATLAAVLLYAGLPLKCAGARAAAYAVLASGVYYAVAGGFGKLSIVLALTLFAALCALLELRRGGARPAAMAQAVAYLPFAAAAAYLGERYLIPYSTPDWSEILQASSLWPPKVPVVLFLFYPAVGLWLAADVTGRLRALASRSGRRGSCRAGASPDAALREPRPPEPSPGTARREPRPPEASPDAARQEPRPPAGSNARLGKLIWVLQTGALVWLVSTLCLSLAMDTQARRVLELESAVLNERWAAALAVADEMPSQEYSVPVCQLINLALFESGRLTSDMFRYRQIHDKMVLQPREPEPFPYMYGNAEVCLRLGRANDAEHIASETIAFYGRNPYSLRQLARIQMAKGNIPAARLFLNALRHDLVHRGWAQSRLAAIEQDPGLASHEETQRLRRVMLRQDDVRRIVLFLGGDDAAAVYLTEEMLLSLLKERGDNRMAFEYLLGTYLLGRRLDLFVQNIHRLDDVGAAEIPLLYQEALVLYTVETGKQPNLHGRSIHPAIVEKHRRFTEAAARLDSSGAAQALAPEYGSTYFYYYRFGQEVKP